MGKERRREEKSPIQAATERFARRNSSGSRKRFNFDQPTSENVFLFVLFVFVFQMKAMKGVACGDDRLERSCVCLCVCVRDEASSLPCPLQDPEPMDSA